MTTTDAATWQTYADAYGFLGNSFLRPMSQTESVGLDPAFWEAFPDFESADVRAALVRCVSFAEGACARTQAGEDMVERVSVEFTRLFVGPPSPAAAPWETMYRAENVTVGFGQATFDMRELLREAGLELKNENHQYEDHIGIELLYLSEMCRRVAENGAGDATDTATADAATADTESLTAQVITFVEKHPLSWIDAFTSRITETYPEGYFAALANLVKALLVSMKA